MSVDNQHPEYTKMIDEWNLVSACCDGHKSVKALKQKVLPPPGASDNGTYDKIAYDAYLSRAVFVNFTGRTQDGLSGAAFRLPPEIDLPPELDYLNSNADGSGQSLEQLAKDVLASLFCSGREILLVDYPEQEPLLSEQEVSESGARAYISRYSCQSLINWKTETVGGTERLVLAVLEETYNDSEDEFSHDPQIQYRVLRLDQGVYMQQIYRKGNGENGNQGDGFHALDPIIPTNAIGQFWDKIPLFIVGSQNNDASVDGIPLSDIAHVNLGHFRNSADLEENCFIHSQLTLGITSDMNLEQFKEANPGGIVVGAKSGHFLGAQGGFTSVQAGPNQLADTLMERKEDQMRKLGAKMIEQRTGTQTAEAARIDATGESSVLADLVGNVEDAFRNCIQCCGEYMGADPGEDSFTLNRQFFDESVDPQQMMVAIQLSDRGVIAKQDLRNLSRKSGMIEPDRTDENIEGESEASNPMSGGDL